MRYRTVTILFALRNVSVSWSLGESHSANQILWDLKVQC